MDALDRLRNQHHNRKVEPQAESIEDRLAASEENDLQRGPKARIHNASGGVLRGMMQVAETPWNIINNAPRLVNLLPGEQGVKKSSEYGKQVGGPVGDFMSWMGEDPLIDAVSNHVPGFEGLNTPNPNYPTDTAIAEGFGTGVAGLGATALAAKTPGMVGKFAQYLNAPVQAAPKAAVAAELAASAGGEMGRQTAEAYDAGPVATAFAQILGSMGPGALAYSLPNAAKVFSVGMGDDAARNLQAMDNLNIRPSIGLVGNKGAALTESGLSALPGFSTVPNRVHTKQFTQFEDAVKGFTSGMRSPGSAPATSLDDMARQTADIADTGLDKIKSGFSAREEALTKAIGPSAPVDTANIRAAIASQMKSGDAKIQRALQKELDDLDAIADAATGAVPYENLRKWRSNFGSNLEDQGVLTGAKKQVYAAVTKDTEAVAKAAGQGDEFTNLMKEQAAAHDKSIMGGGGEIPAFEGVAGAKDIGRVKTFYKDALVDPDKAMLLKQNATPEQWADFKANTLEHLGLAKAAFQSDAGDALSPVQFATNWGKLDPRVKNIIFDDPAIRQTLEDIVTVSKAFNVRGLEANTSRTAGTGMAAMAAQQAAKALNPVGAMTITGTAAGTAADAATTGGTLTTLYALTEGLLSETLARWAAGQTPTAAGTMGARLPGAVGRAVQEEEDDQ